MLKKLPAAGPLSDPVDADIKDIAFRPTYEVGEPLLWEEHLGTITVIQDPGEEAEWLLVCRRVCRRPTKVPASRFQVAETV